MNPAPARSRTDILRTYFYLCLFLFASFWIPVTVTGQYFAGVLAGIVILYIAYRVIVVNGSLFLTPGITRPATALMVIAAILLVIAIFSIIVPPPPMIMPTQNDLIRHALVIGIPLVIGAAGYLWSRPGK